MVFSVESYRDEKAVTMGTNSRVDVAINPVRVVYLQQLWLETADYLLNGVLGTRVDRLWQSSAVVTWSVAVIGTILVQTAQSAQQLALDIQASRNSLRVSITEPTVFVPIDASNSDALTRPWRRVRAACVHTLLTFTVFEQSPSGRCCSRIPTSSNIGTRTGRSPIHLTKRRLRPTRCIRT